MLVLSRKVGTTIFIGDDITLTVFGIKNDQVRLGINASREVSVHREEVYLKIQRDLVRKSNAKVEGTDGLKLNVS